MVNIGETAGTEIANLIAQMAAEIEELRRTKVNVTRSSPAPTHEHLSKNLSSTFRRSVRTRIRSKVCSDHGGIRRHRGIRTPRAATDPKIAINRQA